MIIFEIKGAETQLQAIIHHFGYLLHVSYENAGGANKELFYKFIESYDNIQINF